ncbi:hypothetical protein SOVF_181500 [Spinacia oleracea]|nr:hypothetical protein SOVF_181500 [Spinacia oleracea]
MPSSTQEGPTPAPSPIGDPDLGRCWDNIGNCLNDNINNSRSMPQFDPLSGSFNVTEFYCCSLIQEIASTETPCFCNMNTYLHQFPTMANSVFQIFTTCGIVTSLPALDRFCLGEAPSPAPTPMMSLSPGNS